MKKPRICVRPVMHEKYKYVLDLRAWSKGRLFFTSKVDADYACEENRKLFEAHGKEAIGLSSRDLHEFISARERLAKFSRTIREAADHFIAYLSATEKSCAAAQIVEELLAAKQKDGASDRHLQDLKHRLGKFADHFDGQPIATITTAQINEWLRSLNGGSVSRNKCRALARLAFNFAIDAGYARENPARKSAKAKEADKRPEFLTIDQTAALLNHALPELVPYFAIALFSGLRRSELEQLDWSNFDWEQNLIDVNWSKTGPRYVKIAPNLREWLRPYRQAPKGPVTPRGQRFKRLFARSRKAAGLSEWSSNTLRHAYGSYWLAQHKNRSALAEEMGTSVKMIRKHYDGRAKPSEAATYWNLTPEEARNIIAFA
jgi:integrase